MPQKIRADKISIDVRERAINIIKTKSSGIIVKAGSAELPSAKTSTSEVKDTVALSFAITKAAKSAKIRDRGKCVIVVGGPQIITRSFVWPEMPHDALQFNAESEITHYLPSEIEQFIVSYRILRRTPSTIEGNTSAKLDVLVAAISKDMAANLLSAAKMSGFNPTRIDIRENAREKLVRTPSLWQDETIAGTKRAKNAARKKPASPVEANGAFAILNATDSLIDMTVFVNGVFYASRYFSSNINASAYARNGSAEIASLPNDTSEPDGGDLVMEIASTIDYIQYRERDLKVGSILLFGDEKISRIIMQSLSEHLEIPVIQVSERLAPIVKPSRRTMINAPLFLDAYGAAIAPPVNLSADLNLKPKKKKRHIFKRFVLPILCVVMILSALLTAGIYFPYMRILELDAQNRKLSEELAHYTVAGDVPELQREVTHMTKTLAELSGFHLTASASKVLNVIYGATPSNTVINQIAIDAKEVSISGTSDTLDRVAEFIIALRSDELFAHTRAQTAHSYPDGSGTAVDFEITLIFPHTEDEE